MKLSLMAAKSENGIIGSGLEIPWHARGEQLLFKAMTFNQWLLVGRKTFESMGILPNRKYAVVSRSGSVQPSDNVLIFSSIDQAMEEMADRTNHIIVAGGGQVFASLMEQIDIIHLTKVHITVDGDVSFPPIPDDFELVFQNCFESNINYTYEIWRRNSTMSSKIKEEISCV